MPNREIIVVGTSAGGVEALMKLVGALPGDFPGSVFVVQHTSPDSPNLLAGILARAGQLPARLARDGETFLPSHVYVAPADHHLLLDRGRVTRVTRGPKENRFRPAVDPLFRSAARVYGAGVVGVVLTGGLDDGTAGLLDIKRRGGTAVVQDPRDALYPSMPQSALRHVEVDHCLPVDEIGPLLVRLAGEPAEEGGYVVSDELDIEVKIALEDKAIDVGVLELGDPSPFACPDCHGVLLRLKMDGPLRFRCHTGHGFTADSLLSGVTENVEESLWSAIRSMQEAEMLLRHMAEHFGESTQHVPVELLLKQADDLRRRSDVVRQAVLTHESADEGDGSRGE
jgi:two-component system, chemotaxis family, protein-glutamate methylesterase/glutaminase